MIYEIQSKPRLKIGKADLSFRMMDSPRKIGESGGVGFGCVVEVMWAILAFK